MNSVEILTIIFIGVVVGIAWILYNLYRTRKEESNKKARIKTTVRDAQIKDAHDNGWR